MVFKKFHNKILGYMKTFDVTIDHILVHFIGSKRFVSNTSLFIVNQVSGQVYETKIYKSKLFFPI